VKNKILYLIALLAIVAIGKIKAQATHEIKIDRVESIDVYGPFNIFLSQGKENSVKIVSDKELDKYLDINAQNGKLRIKCNDAVDNAFGLLRNNNTDIFIVLTDVKSIKVKGISKLESLTPLNFDTLNLDLNGIGKSLLEMNAKASQIFISGIGDYNFKGKADVLMVNFAGIGSFDSHTLISKVAMLNASGIGSCSIYASDKLTVNSSGIGNVNYYGKPQCATINKNGLGAINQE
jgi:hypothetical protein